MIAALLCFSPPFPRLREGGPIPSSGSESWLVQAHHGGPLSLLIATLGPWHDSNWCNAGAVLLRDFEVCSPLLFVELLSCSFAAGLCCVWVQGLEVEQRQAEHKDGRNLGPWQQHWANKAKPDRLPSPFSLYYNETHCFSCFQLGFLFFEAEASSLKHSVL